MEQIIQKAVDGGYITIADSRTRLYTPTGSYTVITEEIPREVYVCDPLFFQALGKSCGWGKKTTYNKPCGIQDCTGEHLEGKDWKDIALRFHEINLTEGWQKAMKYLEDLLTKERN